MVLNKGVIKTNSEVLFEANSEVEKVGMNIDKKSMAYSLTFQNPNDNLTDEEVARYMEKIIKALIEEIGAEVR